MVSVDVVVKLKQEQNEIITTKQSRPERRPQDVSFRTNETLMRHTAPLKSLTIVLSANAIDCF